MIERSARTLAAASCGLVVLAVAAGVARAQPDPNTPSHPPPPVDCDAEPTDSARIQCEARALSAVAAAHERAYKACTEKLPAALRSELVAQEKGWRATLEIDCTSKPCMTAAIRSRDDTMFQAFPQCGPANPGEDLASSQAASAKTGMLPARFTSPKGVTEPVPFSFEAASAKRGTMSTALGDGGEQFHGSYVRVEASTKDHLVTEIYDGFSAPEWQVWEHDPDGGWTATGVSFGAFAHFYTGKVVATLAGNRGSSMRCQLTLREPESGLSGGGSGGCQVSSGGTLRLEF